MTIEPVLPRLGYDRSGADDQAVVTAHAAISVLTEPACQSSAGASLQLFHTTAVETLPLACATCIEGDYVSAVQRGCEYPLVDPASARLLCQGKRSGIACVGNQ